MTASRTDAFVPLTNLPASKESREFRVKVMPDPGKTRPLPPAELQVPSPSAPVPCASAHGEPRISLQYDGDRIASIRVQCACGQVMDLACVYDPPSAQA
jgi:hypothetical protein